MLDVVQAAAEHRRAGDEDDGQRGLEDEQRGARERRMIARRSTRSAQRIDRISPRRQPGGYGAEEHAGDHRDAERERQHQRRRACADGKKCRDGEREREQQPRGAHRDDEARDAAADGEQDAFDERLRDDLRSRRADGHPYCRLRPSRDRAREQQVRDVRAGDQQHESAHGHQQLQAAGVLLFHHADAGAGRDDRDRLLRQQVVDVGQPVRRPARVTRDPLAQDVREPRRDAVGGGAGFEAADDAQPGGDRLAQQRVGAGDHRFVLNRDPEVGRIVAERIAEEARRRHAGDRERVAFDDERLADERLIAAVDRFPRVMADHDDGRRRRRVIVCGEDAAAEGADAEGREVVAGDVFRPERARGDVHAGPADADAEAAGLEGGQLFELGRFGFEAFEERVREHAPAILRSALDAAVVAVADAVEAFRVGDRERAQHDRVDQCEDRGRAADTERERQDGRGSEDGRETELTDRVTDGADRVVHTDRLDGIDPPSVDAVPNARRRRAAVLVPARTLFLSEAPGQTPEPRFLTPTPFVVSDARKPAEHSECSTFHSCRRAMMGLTAAARLAGT